jgi:phenylalanyl-tRNA synthetase alpha chain
MLRKGIDDIRLLRSGDPRVACQLLDLEPYQPVSTQPAARRDLSIATAPGTTAEELGDRVRASLGDDAAAVEEVAVLAETPAAELPAAGAARLGIAHGQANLLVRVLLRHPTRTLDAAAANALRDRIYAALHEGSVATYACRPGGDG